VEQVGSTATVEPAATDRRLDTDFLHTIVRGKDTMRMRTICAPGLVVLASVAAIGAAPLAVAAPQEQAAQPTTTSGASAPAPHQSCLTLGGTQSQCQSPGNVQINDSLPQVDYFPYAGGAT
jgi:hypothetical protein